MRPRALVQKRCFSRYGLLLVFVAASLSWFGLLPFLYYRCSMADVPFSGNGMLVHGLKTIQLRYARQHFQARSGVYNVGGV